MAVGHFIMVLLNTPQTQTSTLCGGFLLGAFDVVCTLDVVLAFIVRLARPSLRNSDVC